MPHIRRTAAIIAAGAALALALGGCVQEPTPEYLVPPTESVTIVVQVPSSGERAFIGNEMVRGAQLAARQLDALGGIADRRVEIVAVDEAAGQVPVEEAAAEVLALDPVGVLGPYDSDLALVVLPEYRAAELPTVRFDGLSRADGLGVSVEPTEPAFAASDAQAIIDLYRPQSVGIVHGPDIYDSLVAEEVRQSLIDAGIEVPVVATFGTAEDPAAELSTLQAALDEVAAVSPDVTFISAGAVASAWAAQLMAGVPGFGACFLDFITEEFVQFAGTAAADCVGTGYAPPAELPRGEEFIAQYDVSFPGERAGTYAAFAYDAVMVIAEAARAAGSWDRTAVSAGLSAVTLEHGMTGPIAFDPATGDPLTPHLTVLEVASDGALAVNRDWLQRR